MSLSITDIENLVKNDVYPVITDEYERHPKVWPMIADVKSLDPSKGMLYGWKESNHVGPGRLEITQDGQEAPATSIRDGRTRQGATKPWAARVDIPERVLEEANAIGKIGDLLQEQLVPFGGVVALQEEDAVASILENGTLTAGHADFDGTFKSNVDPNPLFIFDGLPLFDTAHALLEGSGTYSNHAPTGSTSQTNIESYLDIMSGTNNRDERGEVIAVRPNTIVAPVSEARAISAVVGSPLRSASANNDINTMYNELQVIPWQHLQNSAGAGYIMEAGKGIRVRDLPGLRVKVVQNHITGVISVVVRKFFMVYVIDWRQLYNYGKAAA